MNRSQKDIIKGFMLAATLFLLLIFFFGDARADCGHGNNPCEVPGPPGPQGEPGDTGPVGPIGLTGAAGANWLGGDNDWSNDDLDEMFAGGTAMAGLDFDSTTTKNQVGVAIGGYNGEEVMAIGFGRVWDSDKMGDILFSIKTTVQEVGHADERPWVASAVWKF